MPKTLARKSVETTLVIRDSKGNEVNRYKVEIFKSADGDFGVRFLEGELMEGMEATLPASAAADALGKRGR